MSYFVKQPDKYRRESKKSKYGRHTELPKVSPIWTFSEAPEAIEFAKSFQVCYVQVWHEGKVIFQNFAEKPAQWLSLEDGLKVKERNESILNEVNEVTIKEDVI